MSQYTSTLPNGQLPSLEYPDGSNSGNNNSGLWTSIIGSVTSIVTAIFGRANNQQANMPVYYQPTQQTGINTTTIILIAAALMVVFLMREPSRRRR